MIMNLMNLMNMIIEMILEMHPRSAIWKYHIMVADTCRLATLVQPSNIG